LDNIKANQLQNFNQKARKMKPKIAVGHAQSGRFVTGLLPTFQLLHQSRQYGLVSGISGF
jgi:hypothetical protein